MTAHELCYRAGSQGLEHLGVPNESTPHWYCSCDGWRVNRDRMGRPHGETATKQHRKHVREAEASDD